MVIDKKVMIDHDKLYMSQIVHVQSFVGKQTSLNLSN